MPKPLESINDFVVKFANVNGSGSASANGLFAKSILRMGIPASSRNIFPSNIQGLPTWFEVRISEGGHLGRRGGVDMMVAMNPQTWNQDIAEIEPGGYLLYDSTKPMPPSRFRDDINVIGAPLTEICNRTYDDMRQRQLFKNIIYLGVLSALLDMDVDAIEKLIAEQSLYVSDALKTGRVMVKDEDVCLHCGLCAERCPTAAWDMRQFDLLIPYAGRDAGRGARDAGGVRALPLAAATAGVTR